MATLVGDEVLAPADRVDSGPVAPPLVSLLSSAIVVDADSERGWGTGVTYEQLQKGLPSEPYWWHCFESGGAAATAVVSGGVKASGTAGGTRRFRPFDVLAAYKCSGSTLRSDREALARQLLAAVQSAAIEKELWTGTVATAAGFANDFLTNSPTALNGGTALGPRRALAELEQANAEVAAGNPAMIHAEARAVTAWVSAGLVTPSASGRQLRTALGTLVVPGAGYPGTGTGVTDSTATDGWAYVTGMVRVWLGPVLVLGLEPGEFVSATNDLTVRAERSAVYAFDSTPKHGVKLDLSLTDF